MDPISLCLLAGCMALGQAPQLLASAQGATTENGNSHQSTFYTVAVGEVFRLEGQEMKFTRVLEDSRCPMGAQCAWAGRLVIELEVKAAPPKAKTLAFPAEASPVKIGPWKVAISDAQACKNTKECTVEIEFSR